MSQSKSRTARKSSLRDQLAKKRAKVITEYFPIDDDGEAAAEKLEEAERLLQRARSLHALNDKADFDFDALEKAVADAEVERDKTCIALRIRGLSEDDRDALNSEYPTEEPPKVPDGLADEKRREAEKRRDDVFKANKRNTQEWTFAALAQVVDDSDMTANDWREELSSGRWTAGDVERIRLAILRAYGARPAEAIPKD